ncbi:kxDL motif-containing protein CG10681 [Phlebotomus argentipes]|uniref:kxDL motif-containing protein CG10681 n=1 Tax=Phlebotomus argentipes TaxID=94469 RepID=UPI0028932EC7|nr:kxDL motif-containing protein CG10681 [Phlebotomus argentipes]
MNPEMSSSVQSRKTGPHGTPESEFSIECFQNYLAPEVFVQGLAGIVNQGEVERIIYNQKQMLQRFEKTNEMTLNCNILSASRLKKANEDFKEHTKLLHEMKKDLDYIFKKIRTIRGKLTAQYPQAFAELEPQRSSFAEEAEDETEGAAAKAVDAVEQSSKAPEKKLFSKKSQEVEYVQMEGSDNNASGSNLSTRTSSTDNSNDSLSDTG